MELSNSKVPNIIDVQKYEAQHLSKFDDNGISFDKNWTHEQVVEKLKSLFPTLFNYFAALPLEVNNSDHPMDTLFAPQWMLLVKQRTSLHVLNQFPKPNGMTIFRNTCLSRVGFKNQHLFLGMFLCSLFILLLILN